MSEPESFPNLTGLARFAFWLFLALLALPAAVGDRRAMGAMWVVMWAEAERFADWRKRRCMV